MTSCSRIRRTSGLVLIPCGPTAAPASPTRPNSVAIRPDNMRLSEIGCHVLPLGTWRRTKTTDDTFPTRR